MDNLCKFSQNFRSPALTVWKLWYFEDPEENDHSVTHLINLGYSLEQAQVVGIVGRVGMVGMVGIVGINK